MSIRAKFILLTLALVGGVVGATAAMVVRYQRTALTAQTRVRLDTVMEGVARIAREAMTAQDRLMLMSYLMFLQKEHPDMAFASVSYRGHTARLGADRAGLIYLDRRVGPSAGPRRYTIAAYPDAQGRTDSELDVSKEGIRLRVGGQADLRIEEGAVPAERMDLRLGFIRARVEEEVARALDPLLRKTAAIAALAIAFGTLASLGLGALLTRPIEALAAAAALVGRGRLDVCVPAGGSDEIGTLSRRFNEMTGRLRESVEFREDILHTLTHEINTPLAGLRGYLELWQSDKAAAGPAARGEALPAMLAAVVRMEESLSNALTLFRQDNAADGAAAHGFVWLDEVAAEAVAVLAPAAVARGVRLRPLPAGAVAYLVAPPEDLRRIIMNLISNAIKYTPEGGEIRLGLEANGSEIGFWVRDTGCGIPAEDLPHLFTKFYRSQEDRSRAQRIKGTGLGLNIAHKAALRLGGRIDVQSRVGQGSVFRLTIPKSQSSGRQS
ncbi:MAG: hypothetical protein A2X36_15065 [Elusimicrobia bacterium GWA2_69_24]|nr:MAG: hypothetical protein A2X36_15065 [Elusimicrobia bacterium GWA2_69_24]HBL15628.1 hypothetical protein [Elusimicrobiota bacterium]